MIDLDEHGVGRAELDALGKAFRLGHEEVVAHRLNAMAVGFGEGGPSAPVVLTKPVFNGEDGVLIEPPAVHLNQIVRGQHPAVHVVAVVLQKFRGGHVECNPNFFRGITRSFDGANHVLQSVFVCGKVRGKAALISNTAEQTVLLEFGFEGVVGFHAGTEALLKGVKAVWHDHEFLDVHVRGSVRTAVQDVEHGDGHQPACNSAHVFPKREFVVGRSCVEASHRGPQHGVGTEFGLVGGAVEFNHHLVDHPLFVNGQADKRLFEVVFDVVHGV